MRRRYPRLRLWTWAWALGACSPFLDFGVAEQSDGGLTKTEPDGSAGRDAGPDAGSDASAPDGAPPVDADGGTGASCPVVGEGTLGVPCLIRDCSELQAVAEAPTGVYALVDDIACEGYPAKGGSGFKPIGTRDVAFSGTLLGRGHVITGLRMQRESSDEVGLLGVTRGARVSRLGLRDVDILGRDYVGAFVGSAKDDTRLSEVYATGTVAGRSYVGGLVGDMIESRLTDSYSLADIASRSEDGVVEHAGLLVGRVLRTSRVERCYAQSDGEWSLSPLVGDADDKDARVERCFFDCTAEGGLCRSYEPEGMTSIALTVPEHFVYAGWDYETPIWGERPDRKRPCLAWESSCGAYETGLSPLKGDGSDTKPFQITRCKDLQAIALDLQAAYVLVNDIDCSHYDFGDGYGFFPIGTPAQPFGGELRGDGHTITGLRMLRRDRSDVGLFGKLGPGALVRGLRFEDALVLGDYDVGVVAGTGSAGAALRDCYASGVLGTHYASMDGNGLIGRPLDTVLEDNVDEVGAVSVGPVSALGVGARPASFDDGAATRCAATRLTHRWALTAASCVCASELAMPAELSMSADGAQSSVAAIVPHPTADAALVRSVDLLPLAEPTRLWDDSVAALEGLTLRCVTQAGADGFDAVVSSVSSTFTVADNGCGGTGARSGIEITLPAEVTLGALDDGAPCYATRGEEPLLVGVLAGSVAGDPALAHVQTLDLPWIAASTDIWSRTACDADVPDTRFALDPQIFTGTPDDDTLTLIADHAFNEPFAQGVILTQTTDFQGWTALPEPYFDLPVRALRGSTDTRGLGSPRRLLALHYLDERHVQRVFWYDAVEDAWLQREQLHGSVAFDPFDYVGVQYTAFTPRTGFDVAGAWPWFVALDGRARGVRYVDDVGFVDMPVPDSAPPADVNRKPTLASDGSGGALLAGYVTEAGSFVTYATDDACAQSSPEGNPLCVDSLVVWDLPPQRDVALAVTTSSGLRYWAIAADSRGDLRLYALDPNTGHASDHGALGARSLTTPSAVTYAGEHGEELFVAYTGPTWSARIGPLGNCLGNTPPGF